LSPDGDSLAQRLLQRNIIRLAKPQPGQPFAMRLALRKGDLSPFHEANDEQQNYGADRGVDDRGDNSATNRDAQSPKHPSANERAYNADNNIAYQTKTHAFDDNTREPASDGTDDDEDDQCF